jgi:hypothetical protein
MNYYEPLPTVCEDDGNGGCKKHPPTIRLREGHWFIDEHCPGQRCLWPALQYEPHAGALNQAAAETYHYLISPRFNNKFRNRILRRIQAAEKKRYKEMSV